MNRRDFIRSLGLTAAAVTFVGPSALLPSPALPGATGRIIRTDGWSTVGDDDLELLPGDVLTIAGRYAFNPLTRKPTEHLQLFVVTAIVNGAATLHPRGPMPSVRLEDRRAKAQARDARRRKARLA